MEQAQTATLISSPFPNVGEMPVSWGRDKDTRLAGNHKAIVDLDTGKLFSIVSKDYRIIRHEEAIEEVEQELSRTKGLGDYEAVTDFYNDGGRMRRTYRFKEVALQVKKGDFINPELHLFNSYDKTWPFIIHLGALRVVCSNGLVMGENLLHLRRRHIYELGRMNVAEEVGTLFTRFNQQAERWKGWTEKRLAPRTYTKVLEVMRLGVKATQTIEDKASEEASGLDPDGFPIISVWEFYNLLTWHITHNAVSLNHRVEMESRLRAASINLMR